jgi:hypothetical protein
MSRREAIAELHGYQAVAEHLPVPRLVGAHGRNDAPGPPTRHTRAVVGRRRPAAYVARQTLTGPSVARTALSAVSLWPHAIAALCPAVQPKAQTSDRRRRPLRCPELACHHREHS